VGLVRHGGYLCAVEDFSANVAVLGSSQIERTIGQFFSAAANWPFAVQKEKMLALNFSSGRHYRLSA
jgi:hypothetical protein